MNSISDIINTRKRIISSSTLSNTAIAIPAVSTTAFNTASITSGFNYQVNQKINYLNSFKTSYRDDLMQKLAVNPEYRGDRSKGVGLAWSYEQADVEMGGRGSERWTRAERKEILRRGTLSGAEGHHQQNVAAHPEEQTNPDNIKFYRTKEEHLQKGHGGDFRNESDAPMIDRERILRRTNRRRVIKNEIHGAGLTAVIAFAAGASISFILDMAKSDRNPEDYRRALASSGRAGLESAGVALVCYGISRAIMNPAINGIEKILEKSGHVLSEAGRQTCAIGIVGIVTIVITGAYSYYKLRKAGVSSKESISQVAKQSALSLAFLSIEILLQRTFGNPYAIAFGIIVSLGLLGRGLVLSAKEKELNNRIQDLYMQRTIPQLA